MVSIYRKKLRKKSPQENFLECHNISLEKKLFKPSKQSSRRKGSVHVPEFRLLERRSAEESFTTTKIVPIIKKMELSEVSISLQVMTFVND